ncbi:hypothetical protein Vretimale_194 [Volvox reticuliferus]|uniref:Uncharacterized protein n=1 Tax=Volvox reticuliferus TaxID=1737510 RepID=A0A8J4CDN6_9CHLO|nr:hypothetical protein Vretifemale_8351 [Volvox reticuliferus]GIL93818.1 hypothetical protein Vretimale_194 [Volvox reticuliferus]
MGPSTSKDGDREWAQLLQATVRFAEQTVAHPTFQQVGAAALQLGASCAAFNLTLAFTHVAAGCFRIHCNTPLLAPLWGAASIAAASVTAGHVSRSTLAALRLSFGETAAAGGSIDGVDTCGAASGRKAGGGGSGCASLGRALAALPRQLLTCWDGREALVDAMVGPILYKVLFRHSFHRLLPSHLAQPGAFGRMHIPTSSADYSTAAEKAQLSVFFGRDGCHHCGTRSNGVIGDHMPPYKVVRDALAAREAAGGVEKFLSRVADFIGIKDESLKQVYYAQCRACSNRQAQLMRNGTRGTALPGIWPPELVVHSPARLVTRPAASGVLVGMRYCIQAAVLPGTPPPAPHGEHGRGHGRGAGGGEVGGGNGGGGSWGGRRGGWRWLWEQRPRRGQVELWQDGVGEVMVVLSGGEADGSVNDDDDDGDGEEEGEYGNNDEHDSKQGHRGLTDLFDFACELILPRSLLTKPSS